MIPQEDICQVNLLIHQGFCLHIDKFRLTAQILVNICQVFVGIETFLNTKITLNINKLSSIQSNKLSRIKEVAELQTANVHF